MGALAMVKYDGLRNDPRYWAAATALSSAMAGYELARVKAFDLGTVFEGACFVAGLGFMGRRFIKTITGTRSRTPDSEAEAWRD